VCVSAGAKAFKVGGPNLKVRRPKLFIDFSPEKTCRVNAITNKFRIAFSGAFL